MANRLKDDEKNERIIRNLLKLPENRRCINCNSLGPQYVCTNFSTFICTTCSGIHREFTHRVKSVSMAKFTPQEVSALQGGGNASAREIYLKEWDPQRNSLPDGSNIDRLRDFIKHVYVDRRYTGERSMEMSKHSKWSLTSVDHDATRGCPQNEVEDVESGGSTKRSKTSADGEYSIHSNPETPMTGGSTASRPIGRDKSKRKGKCKVADGDSGVAAELRAMRITREKENQLFAAKIELEREKIKMNNLKMEKKMLANLLARDNLSPVDEEVKNRLIALLFGQT